MSRLIPPTVEFHIGDYDSTALGNVIFAAVKLNRILPISGRVQNLGSTSWTFTVLESADNGVAFPYGAMQFRVG